MRLGIKRTSKSQGTCQRHFFGTTLLGQVLFLLKPTEVIGRPEQRMLAPQASPVLSLHSLPYAPPPLRPTPTCLGNVFFYLEEAPGPCGSLGSLPVYSHKTPVLSVLSREKPGGPFMLPGQEL